MTRQPGVALAAIVLSTLALAGCQAGGSDSEASWQLGTCIDVGQLSVRPVLCSEPHTHVVIDRPAFWASCPDQTDMEFDSADARFCFEEDGMLLTEVNSCVTYSKLPNNGDKLGPVPCSNVHSH